MGLLPIGAYTIEPDSVHLGPPKIVGRDSTGALNIRDWMVEECIDTTTSKPNRAFGGTGAHRNCATIIFRKTSSLISEMMSKPTQGLLLGTRDGSDTEHSLSLLTTNVCSGTHFPLPIKRNNGAEHDRYLGRDWWNRRRSTLLATDTK